MDAESDKLRKETMLKKYGAGTILDLCMCERARLNGVGMMCFMCEGKHKFVVQPDGSLEYHDNDAIHPDVSPENFDRIRKAINNLND